MVRLGRGPFVIGTVSWALEVWSQLLVVQGGLAALGRFVLRKLKTGCGGERGSITDRDYSYLPPVPVGSVAHRAEHWVENLRQRSMMVVLFDRL